MIDWIKKFALIIILGLLGLFLFNTCRSCVKSTRLETIINNQKTETDSLKNVKDSMISVRDTLKTVVGVQLDSIRLLKTENWMLRKQNAQLEKTLVVLREQNNEMTMLLNKDLKNN